MFYFSSKPTVPTALEAQIPARIASKADLLELLRNVLQFPDYFGNNWDALEECIRDLSWLPRGNIALIHKDLPLVDDEFSLATYLAILDAAVTSWRDSGQRNLFVVFPEEAREKIRQVGFL